ncbi:alpha/beta hydrolase [Aestuariimicrobium ganziense]|uniref:alpha/beta hydrolase n=1 Tax=Aestuariimicrobium ganziense TaxID=2773677 RepID=UPI001945113B|nr:alpha/beta hydrolase [Aestuariimicrobium ganziense]
MRRPAAFVLALAGSLVLSSCTLLGLNRSDDADPPVVTTTQVPPTSEAPASQSPSSSSSASGSSAPSSGKVDSSQWPFSGFDLSKHTLFKDVPTSPDRQTSVTSDAKPEGFVSPPPGQGIQRYADQKLNWTACQGGECASVAVPLDWDDPDGQAITIKLFRKKATGQRKGSLFVNPGGPGGSGIGMARGFDGSPFPGFDVVGWDPRGSGESTPVKCGTTAQTDALNALDQSPDDEAEWKAIIKGNQDFAKQCREASGRLLDHISTLDNVRDLDYLRHLVGDAKLTYLGISYGTFVGSLYAELYPQRTGALVLDSAVNITENDSVFQAMGFDLALNEFADWCVKGGECELGATRAEVIKTLTTYFKTRDANPVTVNGRKFHDSSAVLGVAAYLYSGDEAYDSLYNSIMWAVRANDPQYLQRAGDWLIGRDNNGYGSLAYSFPAIACADSVDGGLAEARKSWPEMAKKAPIFGYWMGPGLQCTYWTAKAMPQIKPIAKGAAPILVLGATGDPATPYQQAEWMAEQLDSGVLVGWKGAGHSAYSLGNSCVTSIVHDFVNKGTVPRNGTMC